MNREEMLALLRQEVVPTLGCTEPVCVALAAAAAATAAKADDAAVVHIRVVTDPGVYKNGMAVGIPGFDRVGLAYAAALGALLANPEAGLELLRDLTPACSQQAIVLVESGCVEIVIDHDRQALCVQAEVQTQAATGTALIRDSHANLIQVARDGAVVLERPYQTGGESVLHQKLRQMTVQELRRLAQSADEEDLSFLLEGAQLNGALAQFGQERDIGIGITHTLQEMTRSSLLGDSLMSRIMVQVASGAEGRMSGCPYAVMSSAGSGNHGLTAILPVVETARHCNASPLQLMQALALAHLLNVYIKLFTGRLSATCGCGVSAAASASAAMVLLMGGDDRQIGFAIINMGANLTGMICDGGKIGCALKLTTAVSASVMSACLAMNGVCVPASNGICADTPEQTIRNMGRISKPGMVETDRMILDIMLQKFQS